MHKTRLSTGLLAVYVLAGLAVGVGLAFAPGWFQGLSEIEPQTDPSALSEIRGAGGVVLAATAFVIYALVSQRIHFTALAIVVVINLGWGLGRVVSLIADGVPHASLLVVAAFELTLGSLALFAMTRLRESPAAP